MSFLAIFLVGYLMIGMLLLGAFIRDQQESDKFESADVYLGIPVFGLFWLPLMAYGVYMAWRY